MKSKIIYLLLASILILTSCGQKDDSETSNKTSNELEGEITFWHSFTQGPRKEYIEKNINKMGYDVEVIVSKHNGQVFDYI